LKHYVHNGLSIYQVKYCETTFLALPRIAYIIFNRPAAGEIKLLRQKLQQTYYYYRIATEHAKHVSICCFSFNKNRRRENNCAV